MISRHAKSEIFFLNELHPSASAAAEKHHLTVLNQSTIQRSQTSAALLELSGDSLVVESREGNYEHVKEILKGHMQMQSEITSGGETNNQLTVKSMSGRRFSPIKIDVETHDDMGQTSLNVAARFNHTEICLLLLEFGAKVNTQDKDGWSPLMNAARNGNVPLVQAFAEKKAHLEDRDIGGFTPLLWAVYKNNLNCVKSLLKFGADPNAKCKNAISCLSWAAGRGYYEIVCELLNMPNIKINFQDNNGSTALLWASRKGHLNIVKELVERGANPEIPGMNNSTPLIMAVKSGYKEVGLYLSKLPNSNPNQIDKDGNSALAIAAKYGYKDISMSLLERGAYINTQNKKGDSILITAVKGGHKEIVNAFLSRNAEIDAIGNQSKTALHYAVEKTNLDLVKLLLSYKPDLEIVSKDGDTPLLLATKRKSPAIVYDLLNSGSKVSAVDKYGDNALHVSLRNKNREITELILSNPKNSKYLYKPNRKGETPYKIDASNPKSILTQIFGSRQLNMSEDSILGYDVYSSALAEILSEPSLHTPITVGLYAKWGSGKSFLLLQLKNEMKSFAKLTKVVNLKFDFAMVMILLAIILFFTSPLFFWYWAYGAFVFALVSFVTFTVIIASKIIWDKRGKEWALKLNERLAQQITIIKLISRILFLNPFYHIENTNNPASGGDFMIRGHKNLKFLFIEYGKISTIGGETALALMIASLYSKLEMHFGVVTTRLCRVFYTKQNTHTRSKFRHFCFIPVFVFVVGVFALTLALGVFLRVRGLDFQAMSQQEKGFVLTVLLLIIISLLGSSITWTRFLYNIIVSPSSQIMSQAHKSHSTGVPHNQHGGGGRADTTVVGLESLIFQLKREVDILSYTVRTIDAFAHSCTRLVIVIDGLDSCEQSKVVQVMEIVHVLFTRDGDPFISMLAVDPHVLIKGIEGSLTEPFRNGTVNGHDYLRTIIHLPVYLQVNLTKAKALGNVGISSKFNKTQSIMMGSSQDIIDNLNQQHDPKHKSKAKKNESNKPMNALDLTDQLIKSDYFLDVNPRNIRRLINIIALTGRLLRAYHIDFNWRVLASWIYLNEQWPYRCSWIVMYYEDHEDELNEQTSLSEIYEKVRCIIPSTNEPLLDLDRNPRKFEQFLQNCEPKLTCMVLKRLLPCTCNLDPYLIKLIKESIESNNERQQRQVNRFPHSPSTLFYDNRFNEFNDQSGLIYRNVQKRLENHTKSKFDETFDDSKNLFQIDCTKALSEMSVNDIIDSVSSGIELSSEHKPTYIAMLKEKNICGKVLTICDLDELKSELGMTFGDWLLFKSWIVAKRRSLVEPAAAERHYSGSTSSPWPKQAKTAAVATTKMNALSHIPEIVLTSDENDQNDIGSLINGRLSKEENSDGDDEDDQLLETNKTVAEIKSGEESNSLKTVSKIKKKFFSSIENLFNRQKSISKHDGNKKNGENSESSIKSERGSINSNRVNTENSENVVVLVDSEDESFNLSQVPEEENELSRRHVTEQFGDTNNANNNIPTPPKEPVEIDPLKNEPVKVIQLQRRQNSTKSGEQKSLTSITVTPSTTATTFETSSSSQASGENKTASNHTKAASQSKSKLEPSVSYIIDDDEVEFDLD